MSRAKKAGMLTAMIVMMIFAVMIISSLPVFAVDWNGDGSDDDTCMLSGRVYKSTFVYAANFNYQILLYDASGIFV
jgi:hypothetical protein